MKLIYIIEILRVDPMENDISAALYKEVVGYVESKEDAEKECSKGGTIKGQGWPIQKEKVIPKLSYREIKPFRECVLEASNA